MHQFSIFKQAVTNSTKLMRKSMLNFYHEDAFLLKKMIVTVRNSSNMNNNVHQKRLIS